MPPQASQEAYGVPDGLPKLRSSTLPRAGQQAPNGEDTPTSGAARRAYRRRRGTPI